MLKPVANEATHYDDAEVKHRKSVCQASENEYVALRQELYNLSLGHDFILPEERLLCFRSKTGGVGAAEVNHCKEAAVTYQIAHEGDIYGTRQRYQENPQTPGICQSP
mmetsp:Transcript_62548/g.146714  ORF Transcript_62548/g.146714 Transcript_62548/m.146714 type:complete len:108 (-) Transcript_62548:540-863(-)